MYPCQVFADRFDVSILSLVTMNTVTIDVKNVPGGFDCNLFSPEEKNFLRSLRNVNGETNLSAETMRRFKALADRFIGFDAGAASAEKEIDDAEKFDPDVLAKLAQEERELKELRRRSQDFSQLRQFVYYVPVRVSNPSSRGGHGRFADNAARMYGIGVHFDGSTWTVKDGHLPTEIMADMDRWNEQDFVKADEGLQVAYRLLKYHPDELAGFRQEAFERMAKRVRTLHKSLLESIDAAAENLKTVEEGWSQLTEPVNDEVRREALCKRNDKIGGALCTARRELEKTINVAQVFEESGALEDLFASLRAAIRSHESSLAALRRAVRVK